MNKLYFAKRKIIYDSSQYLQAMIANKGFAIVKLVSWLGFMAYQPL